MRILAILAMAGWMSSTSASAQTNSPPMLDSTGKEHCLFVVTDEAKQKVGTDIFRHSDRMMTVRGEAAAKAFSTLIGYCLDELDRRVEAVKTTISATQPAESRAFIARRRASAFTDARNAMIQAGYRPSTAAPKRYAICEFAMYFHPPVVPEVTINSVWSPVFIDNEADIQNSRISGLEDKGNFTKAQAAVIEAMRTWTRTAYKTYSSPHPYCEQYLTIGEATQDRANKLEDGKDKPAKIALPAGTQIPNN